MITAGGDRSQYSGTKLYYSGEVIGYYNELKSKARASLGSGPRAHAAPT